MPLELTEQPEAIPANSPDKATRSRSIGWLAVALSLAALASGAMPHYFFGEPLPNPFARRAEPLPQPAAKPPLIVIEGDKLAKKIEDVEQAAEKFVAKAGRLGDAARGWRRKLGLMKDAPADALLPENVQPEQVIAANEVRADAEVPAAAPAIAAPAAPQAAAMAPGRMFLLAAVFLAIASLPVALASWIYERQQALPVSAICCSTLAVTWQYVLVGVVIGIVMAVFLYVLVKLVEVGG